MSQKVKIIIGIAALALVIAGAALTYDALREKIKPEISLAEQPGNVLTPSPEGRGEPGPQSSQASGADEMEAPDFTVVDADGNSVSLSDFEGKPVVLNFWASWCPPCKAEMPEFDKVCAELGGEIHFMMVDMTDGQRETVEKGAQYVAEQGFAFPVYYDTEQEAAYTYGIRSIPTTIFIDSEGFIVTGAEGQLDEETLRYGISLIVK